MVKLHSCLKTVSKSLILSFCIIIFFSVFKVNANLKGEIKSSYLNVRPMPGQDKPPITSLKKGTKVDILDYGKYWSKIQYENYIGYVSSKFLNVIYIQGTIAADRLYLRPKPGRNNDPIDVLKKGTQVKVLEEGPEWVKVIFEDETGYVSRKYISLKKQSNYFHYGQIQEEDLKQEKITSQKKINKEKLQKLREKQLNINNQLLKHKKEVSSFLEKEETIAAYLDNIYLKLDEAKKCENQIKRDLKRITKEIRSIEEKGYKLSKKIKSIEKHVLKRLVALYKLSKTGAGNILCSASSFSDIYSTSKSLEFILSHDDWLRQKLIQDFNDLNQLKNDLNLKRKQKKNQKKKLKEVANSIAFQKEERARLLKDIRNKKNITIATLKYLKESSNKLDKKIESLNLSIPSYKSEEKITTRKNIFRKNFNSFSSYKGYLRMPVTGNIISTYGSYTNPDLGVTNFKNGIDIKAEKGEPIKAVYSGKILYADWFKGYGNMIIIDHGDSYYTVYAHVDEVFKDKGDPVDLGEVVGTIGETDDGTSLYFEVRHHGKPMNPMDWFKKG